MFSWEFLRLNGEPQTRFTTSSIGSIGQSEFATMSFRDLPAENEANSRSPLFGREEGNEEIRRLR
jgi:hypothetical protein